MWVCGKCGRQSDGVSRICRACGGIVEEISTAEVVPSSTPQLPAVDSTEPALAAVDWVCPHCGDRVPGNFEVCWKCQTGRAGEQPSEGTERSQADESEDSITREVEADDEEPAEATGCPRCGSTKIIPDLPILGQGRGSDEMLKTVVLGDPQALIFKDRLYGEIRGDACGECGNIELRVVNPRKLYKQYLKSRGMDTDDRQFSPVACPRCRMLMAKGTGICPHCGASQADW